MKASKHMIDVNKLSIEWHLSTSHRLNMGPISQYDMDQIDPPGMKQIAAAACILHEHLERGHHVRSLRSALRVLAPYTFKALDSGLILPLNREYKPLGQPLNVHVDYEDYAFQAIPEYRLNLEWCNTVSVDTIVGHCNHHLYKDGCSPWDSAKDARHLLIRIRGILGKTLL